MAMRVSLSSDRSAVLAFVLAMAHLPAITVYGFEDDGRKIIREWKNQARSIFDSGNVICTITYGDPPKSQRIRILYKGDGCASLIEIRAKTAAEVAPDIAALTNSRYYAEIRMVPDNRWMIERSLLPDDSKNDSVNNFYDYGSNYFGRFANCGGIVDYLLGDQYRIANRSDRKLNGRDFVVLEIEFEGKISRKGSFKAAADLKRCQAWFDAGEGSAKYPHRIELETPTGYAETYLFEDWTEVDSMLLPQTVKVYVGKYADPEAWENNPPALNSTLAYDYRQWSEKPTGKEFYLAHYGLPEIESPNRGGNCLLWTAIGVALLAGAVFVIRKIQAKR